MYGLYTLRIIRLWTFRPPPCYVLATAIYAANRMAEIPDRTLGDFCSDREDRDQESSELGLAGLKGSAVLVLCLTSTERIPHRGDICAIAVKTNWTD